MFEHHKKRLLPYPLFLLRVARYLLYASLLIVFSVGIGTWGYHYFADISWIDGFYNASMILTGMGPVAELKTFGAKMFASLYALYSGIAFLTIVAVFFAPIVHRFLHKLHVDEQEQD